MPLLPAVLAGDRSWTWGSIKAQGFALPSSYSPSLWLCPTAGLGCDSEGSWCHLVAKRKQKCHSAQRLLSSGGSGQRGCGQEAALLRHICTAAAVLAAHRGPSERRSRWSQHRAAVGVAGRAVGHAGTSHGHSPSWICSGLSYS